MTLSPEASEIVRRLTDVSLAVDPRQFPTDRVEAARPGMYAWWGDSEACTMFGEQVGAAVQPLLYVGQAGATKWPSGTKSSATLASRIGSQHIRGNARASTFRLTISALLLARLGLVAVTGGKLDGASNALVSEWIGDHLRVVIAPYDDRDTLGRVESEVISHIDAPLNLGLSLPSPARARLTELRRAIPRR